jgi:hypothetical protein
MRFVAAQSRPLSTRGRKIGGNFSTSSQLFYEIAPRRVQSATASVRGMSMPVDQIASI